MPTVSLSVDGHELASIGAQLGGNSVVLNPMAPVPVALSAGRHRLTLSRGGFTLAPGEGGSAYLYGLFLIPAGNAGRQPLRWSRPVAGVRSADAPTSGSKPWVR